MTLHRLYSGGARTENPDNAFFPAAWATPTGDYPPAAHRAPTGYVLEQLFDFSKASGTLAQYLRTTDGALLDTEGEVDQDVLALVIPMKHGLERVYLEVLTAGPASTTVDVRQVLLTAYPTEPTLVGSALATGVSMATLGAYRYTPATQFNASANQGIVIRFNEIQSGGLGNLRFLVSAQVQRYTTGQGY